MDIPSRVYLCAKTECLESRPEDQPQVFESGLFGGRAKLLLDETGEFRAGDLSTINV